MDAMELGEARQRAVQKLDRVPLARMGKVQQTALMRLQIFVIGQTHEMIGEFGKRAKAELIAAAGADGTLSGLALARARAAIEREWMAMFAKWEALFKAAQRAASEIPFGTMAVYHQRLIYGKGTQPKREAMTTDYVFQDQLQALLDATRSRIYGDGLQMSTRIWNLGNSSLTNIQRILFAGVSDGSSAWEVARNLENYLGAGQDCPRWTRQRLYGLTKKDIASGDRRGLLSGEDCDGRGVSYNALRLARTEIQAAHHSTSDALMAAQPWIEQEQVILSGSHPKEDICDDVARGGDNGDGVYPKGTISLPLHPNCICYKTAVLMDADQFAGQLNGWLQGNSWPAMDAYAATLGLGMGQGVTQLDMSQSNYFTALGVWLDGSEDALWKQLGLGGGL